MLFSGHLVRAILEGRKTQTRRPMRMRYSPSTDPGDTIWVRETWAEDGGKYSYRASFDHKTGSDANWYDRGFLWRPSIHMPRRAARLFLEVAAVRAECVAAISDSDAVAEGFKDAAAFTSAWAGIYGSCEGWCWVIEFMRRPAPNDKAE